jgi:dCTP diphosphatase
VFTEKELINIGEEIADVFIYSSRLSDVCDIDLANSIRFNNIINLYESSRTVTENYHKLLRPGSLEWDGLTLEELSYNVEKELGLLESTKYFRSQRHIALCLQAQTGRMCELFSLRPEYLNDPGLPNWSTADVHKLASYLASICMMLAILARFNKLSLSQCISDKFCKNESKYPVDLVRGSSAKYTAYVDMINKKAMSQQMGKSSSVLSRFNEIPTIVTMSFVLLLVSGSIFTVMKLR